MNNTRGIGCHRPNKPLLGLAVLAAILVTMAAGCTGEPQDQVVADFGIAYIKRPVVTEVDDDTGDTVLVDTDLRELITFNEGGDVWFRDRASPSASERNLTACITGGLGDVRDLEASYDGSKLIFALRVADPDPDDDIIPTWNIYEYDVAAGGCPERVISSNLGAEEGDDIAPHYLPDGRIVFSSTRQRETGAVQLNEGRSQFPAQDENEREPAFVLHVMSASGNDIKQISFNQSHDLDPSVLMSGEIVFSRWDHMGGHGTQASGDINLYTVRPDGTELKALYGTHNHAVGTNASTVQYVGPRELSDGKILAMLKPFTGSANGGAPVIIDAANYTDIDQPTWPNQTTLSGPGHVSAVSLDVRTDGSISPAGRFRSVYPLWDGTNRALVSWSQCRLQNVTTGAVTNCDTIPADAVEAFPIYGIYVYDLGNNTALPVVVPQEGVIIEEPVVLAPRNRPAILDDKTVFSGLDADYENENVGLLYIRSVYDFDGSFDDLITGAGVANLADMANPTVTTADTRPARFLRIVKAASIPGDEVHDFDNTAYGRSAQQKMREIIGYAPVEPDGSVMVKVPASVPLAISVVDKDGRRIGVRHQNWIQVRPGESLQCNGCHNHTPTAPTRPLPHGQKDDPTSINTGAPTDAPFDGADPGKVAAMGETMAQTRIRLACDDDRSSFNCPELNPGVDLLFDDVWTDPAGTPTASVYLRYADLGTEAPAQAPDPADPSVFATPHCLPNWDAGCRVIINYETHIHPLWSLPRADPANLDPANTDWTCSNTNCHSAPAVTGEARIDNWRLDLSDGSSSVEPDHFNAYRELLVQFTVQVVREVTDVNGAPVCTTDPVTGVPLVDPVTGDCLVVQTEIVTLRGPTPPMSTNGSRSSPVFFNRFFNFDPVDPTVGGTIDHTQFLTSAEIRLLSEWLDIGAQYYNNPFEAPPN